MPIRINLLAESQAAEELRRKDPVKRSIWIAAFVVSLVLLWSLSLQFKILSTRNDLTALQGKWRGMEADYKQVEGHRQNHQVLLQKHSALDQFSTNRFLWASTLNALQQSLVDNVQLVQFKADQTYAITEGVKPRTNDLTIIPGKPAVATERIIITLNAKDYSPNAEQVSRFKETLTSQPYFLAHLQRTNGVRLTSLSAPQSDGLQRGGSHILFGLQLVYQEKERTLHE